MIKLFDSVSVREKSAVPLLNKHWQIDALQMPDPTLLHSADFYRKCFTDDNKIPENVLFTYFLDPNDEKRKLAADLAADLKVPLFNFMPAGKKARLRPVEEFLMGIDRAKMVLTDSFHGMVFSMIFQTPFAVTGNAKRGMTRFQLAEEAGCGKALLNGEYSLEHCLELSSDREYFAAAQDFLAGERLRGRAYLQENIGGSF